jgi:hypothetical protein
MIAIEKKRQEPPMDNNPFVVLVIEAIKVFEFLGLMVKKRLDMLHVMSSKLKVLVSLICSAFMYWSRSAR